MNDQRLLVVLDGAGGLPQGGVAEAQVAEAYSLPFPIPNLAINNQRLLVVLDGAGGLPQVGVAVAQVAEAIPFPAAIPISRAMTNACS